MAQAHPQYTVVIPVFNSQDIVAETLRRTADFFESQGLSYEIIAVNDGSQDRSWPVLEAAARQNPAITAIDLLRNSGQHNANLCGFRAATGDWLVTLDDDLQNPPEEISHLIDKAAEGYDLVIGRFHEKQHAGYRRLGSRLIRAINQRIFGQEPGLVLTNFRLIRRDVVDRVCAYRGPFPYIPGLCLRYSGRRANALVAHHARAVGGSNYNLRRILSLVSTILFNYSSFPLRLVAGLGLVTAAGSLVLGMYYLVDGLLGGARVPGWTSIVVMLAFFNGVTMLMLAMLGEYVVRVINQLSMADPYFVRKVVNGVGDG
ncbi:MAG: glycosyltransferase family 2 protein [Burkholderiaceae bacterium]